MKLIFAIMTALMAIFATPAVAGSKTIHDSTNAYVKKDKAYWTRVWYRKQAAKKRRRAAARARARAGKARRASYRKSSRRTSKRRGSSRVVARVDLSSQRMVVSRRGRTLYSWPVSTGRRGYRTPTGTWRVHRMHREYYSKKYDNAPMPFAMFYHRGFAIHGTNSISRLGRPASHGCVRLHPSNAATLFSLVNRYGGTVKVVR